MAVAPWVRDELLAMGIGSERNWHVVPVGVDLDPLLTSRPDQREARARLGLPLDGPIVGCVGRLVRDQGPRHLLPGGGSCARRAVPDATFVLAGDGELRERLQAEATALLGDRVRFLGWVDDLPSLYGAFDVVALTSRLEGTPVSLIEASAAGKPVVATNVGGVGDVVRDGNTGLLVPPRDPIAVAANVRDPAAGPRRRPAHGGGRRPLGGGSVLRSPARRRPHGPLRRAAGPRRHARPLARTPTSASADRGIDRHRQAPACEGTSTSISSHAAPTAIPTLMHHAPAAGGTRP